MHGWQQRAEGNNKEHHFIQTFEGNFPPQTFKQSRSKFQRHDADIDGHTDRRFEQYRVHVEVARNVEIRQVPVTTNVNGDRQTTQRVAKQARQQRRTYQRMVLSSVENIHRPRQRPTAAREAGTNQQVKRDPYTPWETAVQIGD